MKTTAIALMSSMLVTAIAQAHDGFSALDLNHNGTLDDGETLSAGHAAFKHLDADDDGKLSVSELGGRLGSAVIKAADLDADGTLNGEEYDALVKARFKGANTDGDGLVDRKELNDLAGQLLLIMIRQ